MQVKRQVEGHGCALGGFPQHTGLGPHTTSPAGTAAGFLAGDVCLREIAQALAQTARRPADLLARYGGDGSAGPVRSRDVPGQGSRPQPDPARRMNRPAGRPTWL
ncbi:MAG: diguanylate cyclase [Thiobacillus sp.]|nr:diguanylate cyclase [Thiobacillus sp.]